MKAVVLAGGTGERLKPLTNVMPKALAPIDGIPILKQQIDNLALIGIKEFVILTGYRSDMIRHYLQVAYIGSELQIEIRETPPSFSPGQRLIAAKDSLSEDFLLLYCDNLVNDLEAIKKVIESNSILTFLVEQRREGNVYLQEKAEYFLDRSSESPYVEIGYTKVNSNVLFKVLNRHQSLQQALKDISVEFECGAILTGNSLDSVSTMDRFNTLRSPRRTILLDRDGILNHKMPHREYLSNFSEYRRFDENINSLESDFSENTDFIVITNQPGVATGQVSSEFLDRLHSKMIVDLLNRGISVIGLYTCVHHWDEGCECRKPKPGMILQAIKDYNLVSERVVYIGDESKDMEAANLAKIKGVRIGIDSNESTFSNLLDAREYINSIIG